MSHKHQPPITVAVVVLDWNGGEDILRCASSIFASRNVKVELVVVDNGSSDGSAQLLQTRFPLAHLLCNPQNLGFAKGSNQGMIWAVERGIPYVLLLNGDARVAPDTISLLLNEAIRENNSVVTCPKIYLDSKTPEHRIWFAWGTVTLWAGFFRNPAFNQLDSSRWSQRRDMEYASGCCMFIPADILKKVGMFDERFFAYCEDIDLSLRFRRAGFPLRYVPDALVSHGSAEPTSRSRSGFYRYLSTRNNLWVVRKHAPLFQLLTCICILPVRSLFRMTKLLAHADVAAAISELRGVRDGLFRQIAGR